MRETAAARIFVASQANTCIQLVALIGKASILRTIADLLHIEGSKFPQPRQAEHGLQQPNRWEPQFENRTEPAVGLPIPRLAASTCYHDQPDYFCDQLEDLLANAGSESWAQICGLFVLT
jgi:hypothetical protein